MKKLFGFLLIILSTYMAGCASVPMAPAEDDTLRKKFMQPSADKAGLYIFRNSRLGGALKKNVSIDGELIGESAPMTYFYRDIAPGKHSISTESEFSDNTITLEVEGGKNYFVKQYIKMGVFVGGANLEQVSELEGKKAVSQCKLAK